MAKRRFWHSPLKTGLVGLPPTKQPKISVPPAMDDKQTSFFQFLYT